MLMADRKKILINWDYTRMDLLVPFLKMADEIDFVFIYFKTSAEDFNTNPGLNCLYWDKYATPYALLSDIKPDKVIFCDIESFHQVALNIACKNRSIKTFHLEHGVKDPDEISLAYNDFNKNSYLMSTTKTPALSTFFFFIRSIKLKNVFSVFDLIRFIYFRRKYGIQLGLNKCRFALRNANYYINFTKENSLRLFERDNISDDQLILIGNPGFDAIFEKYANSKFTEKEYYLLIDTPLADDPAINYTFESVNMFYTKLNKFCISQNAQLYIKLHPRSYLSLNEKKFLEHSNIRYIMHSAELTDIIFEAKACFGFFSTLLIPVIFFKKCILFETGIQTTQRDWEQLGMVKNVDFFKFIPEDIDFSQIQESGKKTEEYVTKYLFKADANSTQRLKEVFIS